MSTATDTVAASATVVGVVVWLAIGVATFWVVGDGITYITGFRGILPVAAITAVSLMVRPLWGFWFVCGLISYFV